MGTEAKKGKISLFEMVAYGFGGFGRGMFNAIAMGQLNYFYTNSLGLSAAVVGMVFMLSRFFDSFTDVLVGALVDKTKSRFGKARIWLLCTCIPFGIGTYLLFTVPQSWGPAGQLIYIIVTYNLCTSILGTTWYVPHMTLPARMTRDQGERAQITNINQIFAMLSSLPFSMILFPQIVANGNTQEAWVSAMRLYAVVGVIAMGICAVFAKEHVDEEEPAKKQLAEKIPFGKMFKALITNKYWVMILLIFIFDAMSNNFANAVATYYSQYLLGDATVISRANLYITAALVIVLFGATPFVKKYGKRKIFIMGSVIKFVGILIMGILPVSASVTVASRVIEAFGRGFHYATMYAMVPDAMEYGEWKTGIRVEGTMMSACSLGAKIGVGFGPGLAGIIMDAAGFDGLLTVQPASALTAINACLVWIPLAFAAGLIVLGFLYKLDDQYDEIVAELARRKGAAS